MPFELNVSNGSGIRDPPFEIMGTDRSFGGNLSLNPEDLGEGGNQSLNPTANIYTYTPIIKNTVYIMFIRHCKRLLVAVHKSLSRINP